MLSLLGFLIRDLLRKLYLSVVHFLIGHLLTDFFSVRKEINHKYMTVQCWRKIFVFPNCTSKSYVCNHQEGHKWLWRITHKILSETEIMMTRGSNEDSHYIISWIYHYNWLTMFPFLNGWFWITLFWFLLHYLS